MQIPISETNTVARLSLGSTFNNPHLWQTVMDALTVYGDFPDPATNKREEHRFFWPVGATDLCIQSGLVPYITEVLAARGYTAQVTNYRTPPTHWNTYPDAQPNVVPTEDQHQIARLMMERSRGVLDLATNFGKTFLAGWFWLQAGRPTLLFLVPTQALLTQTASDLEKMWGLPTGAVGRVGAGVSKWAPVTVGVINSVTAWVEERGSLPLDFGALLVDEGHIQVSEMVAKVAAVCDAYYRFWMSGTAYKDGDRLHVTRISGLSGPLLARINNLRQVELGKSARPVINFVRYAQDPPPGGWAQDWRGQYKALKENEGRNDLIRQLVEAAALANLTSVVFVEHKDHLRRLHALLPWADVVMGAKKGANEEVRRRLEDRVVKCVIATSAWRVGVSVDCIDHLVHAGGGKSSANIKQELGRALRMKAYGDNSCWYSDILDEWARYPRRQSQQRVAVMRAEGFPVNTVRRDDIAGLFS